MTTSLFDDQDAVDRSELAERRAVRRAVLGGVLKMARTARGWAVNDAASAAGIAPMTWRRLEDGLEVRRKSLAAVDKLLGLSRGGTQRALDDDLLMLELAGKAGVDVSGVAVEDVEGFLDVLAERFRTGRVTGSASADLGGLRAGYRVATGTGQATFALGALQARVGAPAREVAAAVAGAVPETPSAITIAAQLVDRMTSRPMTEAIEHAIAAILAAMPDLVRGGDMRAAAPAGDVLAQQATEEAIAQQRSGDRS